MSVCMLPQDGEIVVHRNMPTSPDAWLTTLAPSREQIVIAVTGLCTWDGLADLCAREGMPCVLGPALSRPALHGGKATNDPSDAQKMAVWLRGGRLPPAYG
jgi:hypothetical protein